VGGLFAVLGGALLVLGKKRLARLHLVPQKTVETMQENVQWIKNQVGANGTAKSSLPR
jgi:Putative Actinobacterial Holin-X, holin superfamily III